MSYPQARALPQVAVIRGSVATVQDAQLRQLVIQLCDAIDYLNAQLHMVADATSVALEE